MSDQMQRRNPALERVEEDIRAPRRQRPGRNVIDPQTGEKIVPESRRLEHHPIAPGTDPLADAREKLRIAGGKLDEAKAGVKKAEQTRATCEAERARLATRWAEGDPDAGRLAEENEQRLGDAMRSQAMHDDRIAAAEQMVDQARSHLELTKARHLPHLVQRIVADGLPAILEARAKAIAAAQELHELTVAFSRRARPLNAPLVEWLDSYWRAQGQSRSDGDLARETNVPRPPLNQATLDALGSFDPLSPAMRLLLAEQEQQPEK